MTGEDHTPPDAEVPGVDPDAPGETAADFPDELQDLDENEREQRAQELEAEVADEVADLQAEQEEILADLQEEHGGNLVETRVTLPGDNPASISCELNGELIDRMSHVGERLDALDEMLDTDDAEEFDAAQLASVPEIMDEAAQILDEMLEEPKYSKDLFYQIYERYGPEALGEHLEAVFDAIEREQERKAGGAKGFREK